MGDDVADARDHDSQVDRSGSSCRVYTYPNPMLYTTIFVLHHARSRFALRTIDLHGWKHPLRFRLVAEEKHA